MSVTNDLDAFPALADNLLQALLNAQVLGNLMESPQGFRHQPAFQDGSHQPLIRPSSGLVYYGNSEGGIMGGAFTALSTEVRRSVLGVPGMDYAVLLPRSADFAPFQALLDDTYPDKAVQQLGFDVMQMLWDRADADGYAEQMTSGLPGTPPHQVLLEEAFGDHQVANVATETEARTIGAHLHEPALAARAQPGVSVVLGHPGPPDPVARVPPSSCGTPGCRRRHSPTPRPPTALIPTTRRRAHSPLSGPRCTPSSRRARSRDPCGARPCTGPAPPPGS